LGSVRKNSETLNTLREKVNSRLSQMGTGQIVYQEDEQLGNPAIKLVNIHKLPQSMPNNLQILTPRTPSTRYFSFLSLALSYINTHSLSLSFLISLSILLFFHNVMETKI
jgi:hypothetical protein